MGLTRNYDGDSWYMSENNRTVLSVNEKELSGKISVLVAGNLRSDTELQFRDELSALITMGKDIVLDLGQLEYISGGCQDALLSVQQLADSIGCGTLTIQNVPEAIMDEFKKTNLNELLMIE